MVIIIIKNFLSRDGEGGSRSFGKEGGSGSLKTRSNSKDPVPPTVSSNSSGRSGAGNSQRNGKP